MVSTLCTHKKFNNHSDAAEVQNNFVSSYDQMLGFWFVKIKLK